MSEKQIDDNNCDELLQQVLELCEGVPLMLSIAGALLQGHRGTPTAPLEDLIQSLSENEMVLLEKEVRGKYPSCFNQAVKTSLETIAGVLSKSAEFKRLWMSFLEMIRRGLNISVADFVTDYFRRLCILPRSARVSKHVIYGIWRNAGEAIARSVIDALVNFHLLLEFKDDRGKSSFGLHDVILDYCRNGSQYGQDAKYEQYHQEFLIYAWKFCHREQSAISDTTSAETSEDCNIAQDAFWVVEACESGRPWWKILSSSEDVFEMQNYLLQNIFRHLTSCGRLAEAVGLVSHMGWTKLRISRGGIIALNADFSLVANAMRSYIDRQQEHESHNDALHEETSLWMDMIKRIWLVIDGFRPLGHQQQNRKACEDALHGITLIWNMVKRAWPVILNNSGALPTHAYGYLLEKQNELPLVQRYLQSAMDIANGAWFKPRSAFWSILDSSSNSKVFRCAEMIWDAAVVKDSQTTIAVTKSTLYWINVETMNATRERVIRNEKETQSEIRSLSICERQGVIVLGFTTGELELWDVKSGKLLRAIPNAHEDVVWSVDISEDGERVVSGSRDTTVRLWDTQSRTQIGHTLRGHESAVLSVAFSRDGKRVVSGSIDNTIRLWNTQSGTQIGHPLRGHESAVYSVAFSRDGQRVVSGSWDTTVRLWDTQSGTQIGHTLRGHESAVYSVAFSRDGERVVSGSMDNKIRLWNTQSGTSIGDPLRGHESAVYSVAFSRDGERVVSGSGDNTIRLWDTLSRTQIGHTLRGHENGVDSVSFSRDGKTVVSGSWDTTIRLWNTQSGTQIGHPLRGHESAVYSVAFSRDGQRVVSGSGDTTVRLWDTQSRTQIGHTLRGHESAVYSVAFSRDGQRVVSGSIDNTIRLWNTQSGTQIGDPLRGHESGVWSVAFSRDGQRVVSGSWDTTVRLWDTQSRTQIGHTLRGHESAVYSVAFSRDGERVVSGSMDNTVRLWNTQSGTQIGHLLRGHESGVWSVAFSRDGRIVMSRSVAGTVILWMQDALESYWNRYCVCSIPLSRGHGIAFVEEQESSGGTVTLVCPLLGGMMFFDLIEP